MRTRWPSARTLLKTRCLRLWSPGVRACACPGAWDGFEVAVRAMLGQQITVTGALKLAAKLVAAYGEKLCPIDGASLTHTFPTPERLAQADLRSLGMPTIRAEALSAWPALLPPMRDFSALRSRWRAQ